MRFVRWHYRGDRYVRPHFRRPSRAGRRCNDVALFAVAGPATGTAGPTAPAARTAVGATPAAVAGGRRTLTVERRDGDRSPGDADRRLPFAATVD